MHEMLEHQSHPFEQDAFSRSSTRTSFLLLPYEPRPRPDEGRLISPRQTTMPTSTIYVMGYVSS